MSLSVVLSVRPSARPFPSIITWYRAKVTSISFRRTEAHFVVDIKSYGHLEFLNNTWMGIITEYNVICSHTVFCVHALFLKNEKHGNRFTGVYTRTRLKWHLLSLAVFPVV